MFLHFYVYLMTSEIVGVFCAKLTKQCRHARTSQQVSQQRKIFQFCLQNGHLQPPLSPQAPSTIIGSLVYRVYLRIFDPGPSNPTIFLGLCSAGEYGQSIESPMGVPTFNSTEKVLKFTIYDCILKITAKKGVI